MVTQFFKTFKQFHCSLLFEIRKFCYNSSKNKIHSNVSDANPAKKLKKTVKKGKINI